MTVQRADASARRSRWMLTAMATVLVAACSASDTADLPSTTAPGVAATATTSLADLSLDSITSLINEAWPGSVAAANWGDSTFVCESTAGSQVGMGTVLTCRPTPPVEDGQHPVLTALVLTDEGQVAIAESGIVHIGLNSEALTGMGPGLFCRDVFAPESALMQESLGPSLEYFGALAYWFAEGMPARMDADGNGIPCETLVSSEVVDAVWAGGWIEP